MTVNFHVGKVRLVPRRWDDRDVCWVADGWIDCVQGTMSQTEGRPCSF